jgi:hypothetical protein
MFADVVTLPALDAGYVETADWKPFPDIADRQAWAKTAADPRLASTVAAVKKIAEEVLTRDIDTLSATLYMGFMRDGDRNRYEDPYFRRRAYLSYLVIAECLTAEGRYLDKIADYLWAILGEPYWCVPAHNFAGQHEMVQYKSANPWRDDDPLPVPGDEYLDLFNCETAAILAEACYLLKPALLASMPSLYHLVHAKVTERTLALFEGPKSYGWYLGKNNWTAWCAHNLLTAASYIFDDKARLISFVEKLVPLMDRFFANIKDTGSCIEGPTYWVVSAGRLVAFVDLIEKRFRTDLGFDTNAKFRNFGEHLVKLHIAGNNYVNFADGNLKIELDHGLLSRYAQKIGAASLANLIWDDVGPAAELRYYRMFEETGHVEYVRNILIHLTRLLHWTPEISTTPDAAYDESLWLPDMQVMLARQYPEAGRGLMLSAIAGSNDLAVNHHSHNDIGHFSVYLDGEPILIDLGQGTYSKATFGGDRYAMWHINSDGHHVPRLNGQRQTAGTGADARDVVYAYDDGISRLSLDAAPAYFGPETTDSVRRSIVFDHARAEIRVVDHVTLAEGLTSFELPLYVSDRDIDVVSDVCRIRCGDRWLEVSPGNLHLVANERIEITDIRHRGTWGDAVRRLTFSASHAGEGTFALTLRVRD